MKCDACTQTEDTPSLDTVMLEKQLNSLSAKISSKTKELKNVTSQLNNDRLKVITEKGSHFSPSNIKRRERYGKLLRQKLKDDNQLLKNKAAKSEESEEK